MPRRPAGRKPMQLLCGLCLALAGGLIGCTTAGVGELDRARTAAEDYGVPGAAERFEIKKATVREKIETAVLPAMRRHGVDMWITFSRENHYDPIQDEVGGGFPGVRGAYIFFDDGGETPEKIYVGSHEQPANSIVGEVYDQTIYYGYTAEGITPHLRRVVVERDPQSIGVNVSRTLPSADGLTVSMRDVLEEAVGPELRRRIVPVELVVRDFKLNRTPKETELYTRLLEWTSRWQSEALSAQVVIAGETTALDIAWWLQDRARELGMTGGGTVRVVREGELLPIHAADIAVQPGDILSIDGGLEYLGYATDIKRAAYILRPGETVPPASIEQAWRDAVEIGQLYADSLVPDSLAGHEIWAALAAETQARGYMVATPDAGGAAASTTEPEVGIYGHSVGNVAHDIGTRVAQDLPFAYGDRVRFALATGEWQSVELHVSTPIPEWGGKTWYARFEETGQIGPDGAEWLIPVQEELLLISSE